MRPTAAEVAELLGLSPHSTCGLTRETYVSQVVVPEGTLPPGYRGGRLMGGVLYFLVTPEAPIRLHRIRSDQMYHHYLGGPLEVLLLHPDGRAELRVVGSDLAHGMRPQLLIPGQTFHAGRVRRGGDYALLGTSVWARAEPPDVEMGDPQRLMKEYPWAHADISSFTS
jgi:predicted cupin superfamily sugar epimerase